MKPEDARAEELTLKMLGLVPADFDLRKNTLDLLTEQAAAFYDYNQKKLFVLEGSGGSPGAAANDEERVALVHELAHALADQHFHLAKYIREGMRSDDSATARQAVMEGQATWLMAAYISRESGGKPEVPEAVLELMKKSIEGSAAEQYPVFSQAPLYIRESLVFPYADGLEFQDAVFRKLGQRGILRGLSSSAGLERTDPASGAVPGTWRRGNPESAGAAWGARLSQAGRRHAGRAGFSRVALPIHGLRRMARLWRRIWWADLMNCSSTSARNFRCWEWLRRGIRRSRRAITSNNIER